MNPISHAAAQELRDRHFPLFAQQIVQGNLDGAVNLGQLEVRAWSGLELSPERVDIIELAPFQEGSYGTLDDAMRVFTAGSRSVADQSVIGLDPYQHGVTFHDRALAAMERQPARFAQRVGEQE